MAVFFTADHHFGDARRLGIDRRPFGSAAEMDEAMIERWNAAVGRDDEVWHLGDVARTADHAATILPRLAGRKHLIAGNNDPAATLALPGWESVGHYAEITLEDRALILCHYAFRTWNGMARGAIDLHGHSHGRLSPMPRQTDIGVDAWNFRPVTLSEILSRTGRRPKKAT